MKNIKILYKLIIMYIAVSVIPLFIVISFTLPQSSSAISGAINRGVEIYGSATEARIKTYMETKLEQGRSLSTHSRIQEALNVYSTYGPNSPEWQNAYNNLDSLLPTSADRYGFLTLYVIDTNGKGIYASGGLKELIGADFSSREYFRLSMSGKPNISEFMYSDIVNDYFVAVSSPVYNNSTGALIGTINGLLPLEELEDMIQEGVGTIGETGDIYLINKDGLLMTNTMLGEYKEGAAFNITIDTEASRRLTKEIEAHNYTYSGVGRYKEYRGEDVLGGFWVFEALSN